MISNDLNDLKCPNPVSSTVHLPSSCSPLSWMALTGCSWIFLMLTFHISFFAHDSFGHSVKKSDPTRAYPPVYKQPHSGKKTQFSPKTYAHQHQPADPPTQVNLVSTCMILNNLTPLTARSCQSRTSQRTSRCCWFDEWPRRRWRSRRRRSCSLQ